MKISRVFFVLLLVAGCAHAAAPLQHRGPEEGKLLTEVFVRFAELKSQDKLPGLPSTDKRRLVAGELTRTSERNPYPLSMTIRALGAVDGSVSHYTMVKRTPSALWQLDQVKRTDKNGRSIEGVSTSR